MVAIRDKRRNKNETDNPNREARTLSAAAFLTVSNQIEACMTTIGETRNMRIHWLGNYPEVGNRSS